MWQKSFANEAIFSHDLLQNFLTMLLAHDACVFSKSSYHFQTLNLTIGTCACEFFFVQDPHCHGIMTSPLFWYFRFSLVIHKRKKTIAVSFFFQIRCVLLQVFEDLTFC